MRNSVLHNNSRLQRWISRNYFLIILSIFFSCTASEDPTLEEFDWPTGSKSFWVYEVEETVWENNNSTYSEYFEIDSLVSLETDEKNNWIAYIRTYKLEEGEYTYINQYRISRNGTSIIKMDGNNIETVLPLRIESKSEWIGNALDPSWPEIVRIYTSELTSATVPEGSYTNCIRVLQSYNQDCVTENTNDWTIFKSGVGVIQQNKEFLQFDQNLTIPGCVQTYIETGYSIRRSLVEKVLF